MRLFVGLEIPDEVAERITEVTGRLRASAPNLQWSPRENLHITTKFIGSWPDERLKEMEVALEGIRTEPFNVQLTGFGWFPTPHAPKIFWTAARGGEALARLASLTDEATARLGIAPEERAYTPHVTLARVKQGMDFKPLRSAVAELEPPQFGQWCVNEFYLYRSETKPAGSVYTKLAGFSLKLE
jgi:2'-5' RNA ligase